MKRKLLFTGPVLTGSGYGVHARQLLAVINASERYDLYVESVRWGETPFLNVPEFDWIRSIVERGIPDRVDVHVHLSIPNEFKRRAPLEIGVTAGIEVDRVSPDWLLKCNQEVDVVVVPSSHSRDAFAVQYQGNNGQVLRLEKPIFVVTEGVDTSVYRQVDLSSDPEDDVVQMSELLGRLQVPAKNFIFTGLGLDRSNGNDRKNLTKLIEYFCKTFAGRDDVGLILKTAIVNGSTVDFEVVKRRISEVKRSCNVGELPRIFLIHGRLTEREFAEIYNDPRVTAAVSLTHGEGFGLPLLEAAACGLPVMATNWSGHVDFLTKDGKALFVPFDYELKEIPDECVWEGVMERGSRWAFPKESDVVAKLQKMAMSSETPRRWATELAGHIAKNYNLEAAGAQFVDLLDRAVAELDRVAPARTNPVQELRDGVRAKGKSLIYTMPMSAGDVFLSTGVVSALRRKHPEHRVYFATSPQYFDILKDLQLDENVYSPAPLVDELIEWQPWMQDVSTLEDVFDEVYTPNLAVQMSWSNWVHKGRGRHLLDEFAVQCGVTTDEPVLPDVGSGLLAPDVHWVAVHAGGQKSARNWMHWKDLVKNIRAAGLRVVQFGAKDDVSIGEVDMDFRGKTDHAGLVANLFACQVFVGIDSYPMHVANACGLKIVALFGSSYARSTGPRPLRIDHPGWTQDEEEVLEHLSKEMLKENGRRKLLEVFNRNGCDRACYKDVCKVDSSNPCINNVGPSIVFKAILDHLEMEGQYREFRPKIGGYTHVLNPNRHHYPYVESIGSMLGFCDEVVVVDGGSDPSEGVREDLETAFPEDLKSGKLKLMVREWDPDEPGMDGLQKAFARAMVSPDMEFLWQQDADEVVHEDDYAKIVDVCKRFPADVSVVHLPVIELWGDDRHCRTDRHSWKWRLSRNDFRITHGINVHARQVDPNTGKIFAKEGMSDGCEMIDIVSGEHLPHRGFYTKDLEGIRLSNPAEYGRIMNEVFSRLPSVWHYSWADLPRKVRNFRDFWDNQWQVLYQRPPAPRFPDVLTDEDIARKAEELRQRGGEHGTAPTFELTRSAPQIMRDKVVV